jgi:6-methylsalicylate decarboxylase
VVVFFHPTAATYANPLPHIPAPSLEFPFETTRAITSLLYGGTLARSRAACFVFAHAGGAVPFLALRIARLTARSEYQRSGRRAG